MEHLCDGIEPAADTADFLLSDLVHEFEYYADGLRIDLRGLPMEIEVVPAPPQVAETACQFFVWVTVWCDNLDSALCSASSLRGLETNAKKCTQSTRH